MEKMSIYNALKLIQTHKSISLPHIVICDGSGFKRIEDLGYIRIVRNINSNLATLNNSGLNYICRYETSQKPLNLNPR